MGKSGIRKIKRGMIIKFPDGFIDIVISTGYIGKSSKYLNQRGSHWLGTKERAYWSYDWNKPNAMPEILGYADKRDMKRINRINDLVKLDKRMGKF